MYDKLNILRKISGFRFWNLFVLRFSYWQSRLLKKNKHRGLPYALSIEPTTACNLACPACPSGLKEFSRPTGKIDLENHTVWLKQIKKHCFYINYYFQGEPFLHKGFLDLIKEAKKANIYTATSTNAHFISREKAKEIVQSGLDRLVISIDGLTQETYESYRVNGSLDKVIEGSKFLVEAKKELKSKTPHLIFQFLVVRKNEHEIPMVKALTDKLGIDELRFKTAQFYDFENGNDLIPTQEKYARYKKMPDGKYVFKYKGKDKCWRQWSSAVITWDGKLVPCAFDKDALHQIGDLKKQTFIEIWNSEAMNRFRSKILSNRQGIDICNNCSEGAEVFV